MVQLQLSPASASNWRGSFFTLVNARARRTFPRYQSFFSRLAIFSKLVAGVTHAFWAVARWRRRGRVIAKGGVVSEHELDAFISFALETLPPRIDSTEEARALLIAEGILTADGELAPEYRPAGDSSKLHE
jgi:hypothetical protein